MKVRPSLRLRWAIPLAFVTYLACAKFGLVFAPANPSATPVWPPTGIAIAAVLLCGWRVAPAIWAAAFIANLTTASTPFLAALGIASGNTMEAVVGGLLLARLIGSRSVLVLRSRDLPLLFGGAVFATAISATVGPLSLVATTPLPLSGVWDVSRTWWLGDMLGAVVVTTAIMLVFSSDGRRALDALCAAVVAFAVAAGVASSGSLTAALLGGCMVTLLVAVVLAGHFRSGRGVNVR